MQNQEWDIDRWNHALVDEIFNHVPGSPEQVTRIPTTHSFLNALRGYQGVEGAAYNEFLRKVLGNIRGLRSALNNGLIPLHWTPSSSSLPFFYYLYFSLLIARADDDTIDIGNYRERLSIVSNSNAAWPLAGLPRLWEAAERWTHEQRAQGKPIKQLLLPPLKPARIGYVKRLSFPGISDQMSASKLMMQFGLSAASPIDDIVEAFFHRLSDFSSRFKEEFQEFIHTLETDRLSALSLPFWGLLEELTWSVPKRQGSKVATRLLLIWDIMESETDPQLHVHSDRPVSYSASSSWTCNQTHEAFAVGDFRYILTSKSSQATLQQLQKEAEKGWPTFGVNAPLTRAFRIGVLIFVRDAYDRWILADALPEIGEYIWLVAERRNKAVLASLVTGRPESLNVTELSHNIWNGFHVGPLKLTVALQNSLRAAFPDSAVFAEVLRRPSIKVTGVPRISGGYLFDRGLSPTLSCFGCASITGVITGRGRSSQFSLLQKNSDFVFGHEDLAKVSNGDEVYFRALSREGKELNSIRITAFKDCYFAKVKSLNDPSRWLLEGKLGQLGEGFSRRDRIASNAISTQKTFKQAVGITAPQLMNFEDLSCASETTLEVLSGYFTQRICMGYQELLDLLQEIKREPKSATHKRITALEQNGFIERIYNRHWPTSTFIGKSFSLHYVPGPSPKVRVIGLTTRRWRRHLANELSGLISSIGYFCNPGTDEIGALEISFISKENLRSWTKFSSVHLPIIDRVPSIGTLLNTVCRESNQSDQGFDASYFNANTRTFDDFVSCSEYQYQLKCLRSSTTLPIYELANTEFTWSTKSRRWAILLFHILNGVEMGAADRFGNIACFKAMQLPLHFARRTLVAGGGLVLSTSDGSWVYPSNLNWSPLSIFSELAGASFSTSANVRRLEVAKLRRIKGRLAQAT